MSVTCTWKRSWPDKYSECYTLLNFGKHPKLNRYFFRFWQKSECLDIWYINFNNCSFIYVSWYYLTLRPFKVRQSCNRSDTRDSFVSANRNILIPRFTKDCLSHRNFLFINCNHRAESFPQVKRLGRGANHPHPSSAEVKEW